MTDTTNRRLTDQQRADIATARGTLWQAAAGMESLDYDTAASMLDRALATACPHNPAARHVTEPDRTGRPLTTCYDCEVSWHADFPDRLRHLTSYGED